MQQYILPQRVEQRIVPQRVKKGNLHRINKNNKETRNNPRQTRYNLRSNSNLPTHPQHALQHLHTQPIFQNNKALHIYNVNGGKETIGSLLRGENSNRWYGCLINEWGRFSQGNDHGIKGTDTLVYIQNKDIPKDRKITYGSFVCDYRPLKDEKWRVRLVVGGDKLPYELDAGSPAASMLETKILANSVISDAGKESRFLSCDLKYFC